MQNMSAFNNKRDLDCVEYFCGQKAITGGMRRAGFRSVGHDYKQDNIDQDFTTARGFITALQWWRRLRRRSGMTWYGTVCSSFIFLNRGTSRRTRAEPRGTRWVGSVEAGNIMVTRTALLICLSFAKRLAFVLEQPSNSVMAWHPSLVWVRQQLRPLHCTWWSVQTYMGLFGGCTLKPHVLYSNETWIQHVARAHPGSSFQPKKSLCRKYTDSSGVARVSGGDDLKDSQTYTKQFGRAIAAAFKKHRLSYSSDGMDTIDEDEADYEPDAQMAWGDGFFWEVLELLYAIKAESASA